MTAPSLSRTEGRSALQIRVRDLAKVYKLEAGIFASAQRRVWAVNGVSFDIRAGETYGLVGESGSGKTTIARMLVQLVEQTAGTIEYYPKESRSSEVTESRDLPPPPWGVHRNDRRLLRRYRSEVKYIFQDPSSALDPRMSAFRILSSGSRFGDRENDSPRPLRAELRERATDVLRAVGLREADLDRRPSEFSGGQRQRLSLARALFSRPTTLICDEVVSALDVSVQGQILNLLVDLKRALSLTILFIAHDLTVVSYMADRVCVLYGGSVMEEAPSASLVQRPLHPYTQLLYRTIPRLGGMPPDRDQTAAATFNPTRAPVGCPFVGRCPREEAVCRTERPELRVVAPEHRVACHVVT